MMHNAIPGSPFLSANQPTDTATGHPEEIERGRTPPPKSPKPPSTSPFTPERRRDLMRPTPLSLKLLTNKNDHDNNSLGDVLRLISSINREASSPLAKDIKPNNDDWPDDGPSTTNVETEQEKNLKGLHVAINRLIKNDQPKPLLMTLKFLSDYPFGSANTYFTQVLDQLQKTIPDIVKEDYIREDAMDPSRGQLVTRDAVAKLFEFFEKHFNIPAGLLSCQDSLALPKLINAMVTTMKEGEFKGWSISNGISDEDLHTVPVFAIVKNGKVNVFIFDSIGHRFDNQNVPDLYGIPHCFREILLRGFKSNWKDKVAIHSYGEKRQNEGRGCWAFVVQDLRDLAEMHLDRHADSIVDFYSADTGHKNRPKRRRNPLTAGIEALSLESSPVSTRMRSDISRHFAAGEFIELYEINSLPPSMMKVTQSLTKIDQYCRQSEILLKENAFRPHSARRPSDSEKMIPVVQDISNLKETISQNTILNSKGDKQQNAYAGRMRFTYIVYLITSLWEEHNNLAH